MKLANLTAVVFLSMVVDIAKTEAPGALDCACNNVHPGNYCGGSRHLKTKQGEGCKSDYLFQCSTDGKKYHSYPTTIKHCAHGCGTVAGSTKGIGACKHKKHVNTEKANGDPTTGDCYCDNTVGGRYCGGSLFLTGKKGVGCPKNYIFQCTEDGRGTLPTKTTKCSSDAVCISDTQGVAGCRAKGEASQNECGCHDNANEGYYCGGSPFLTNIGGQGCKSRHLYYCTGWGDVDDDLTTKCADRCLYRAAEPGKRAGSYCE